MRDRGAEILAEDTFTARKAVGDLVTVDLTDEQFGALSSFAFNVGKTNLKNSTLLALLNDGNYASAAKQLRRWVKAGGETLDGLVLRRACEEGLFTGTLSYASDGSFDFTKCAVLGVGPDASLVDIYEGE